MPSTTPSTWRPGRAKLSPDQVMNIRYAHATGTSQAALARRYGVSQPTISDLVRGRSWKHLPVVEPVPPPRLSVRQRHLLATIAATINTRGYPPSIRELGRKVGLSSTASVHSQVRTLERRGYLEREPGRPRTIRTTPAARELLAA
jgi:lambda repressor-like predicted transcriptional regulator